MDALAAAAGVARWLRTRAAGGAWPAHGRGGADDTTLAWGPAGVALFLLRAYETLGDDRLLDDVVPALDVVAEQRGDAAGLYTGAAGRAYVLAEAYRVRGDAHRRARALALLDELAPAGPDVYDGAAGVGLTLLALSGTLDRPSLRDRALDLAASLAAAGSPVGDGLRWTVPGKPEAPNFAHGTAGVAFFLAVAGERDAAVAGGTYVLSLARTGDGRCDVPLSPGGSACWASWCHGPAGTVRLWAALAPHDERFAAARDGALASLACRLYPGGRLPDVGDDVSLCCGSAGVHDALLDTVVAGDVTYATAARRALAHLHRLAVTDDDGTRWAGGRAGWLDGAAGVAYTLLRRAAYENALPQPRPLPDAATALAGVPS